MRRILIVFALLLLVGCTTLSPPELTATAAHQTPTVWITNTAIPTDWPTAESTEFPYYRRDCVPDAININACGVQKPYTTQPYNMVVEFWPLTGDDWPDELMPGVHWDDGELVYDVMGDEGGFTGDIVLIFDRGENAPQFETKPGVCFAVNVLVTADFGGVPVRRVVDGVNVGGETQLWMWLKIVLDNGQVVDLNRTLDFSNHQEPTPSLNGEREFFWTFYTNSTNRAIEEFQLGYHQNSMIVKAGNDITFQWINFHGGEGSAVPQSACGNQAPSW